MEIFLTLTSKDKYRNEIAQRVWKFSTVHKVRMLLEDWPNLEIFFINLNYLTSVSFLFLDELS